MAPRWQFENIRWQAERYVVHPPPPPPLLHLARSQKVEGKSSKRLSFCVPLCVPVLEWEGESLELTRISRLDMGAYLCIATNGVPPSVSKRIKVSVDCEYLFVGWRVEAQQKKTGWDNSSIRISFYFIPSLVFYCWRKLLRHSDLLIVFITWEWFLIETNVNTSLGVKGRSTVQVFIIAQQVETECVFNREEEQ